MKNPFIAFIILLAALIVSCQGEVPVTETTPAPTIANLPPQADTTALITLLRNPTFFAGNYLQLSGQYRPIPLAVCSDEGHLSPATWTLVDGEIEIPAAGFDSVLRRLAEPGLPLIVEGRWQKWEGPVGCGRRAPVTEVWYIDVNNIVSPNPITAGQAGEGIASVPIEPTSDIVGGQGVITPVNATPSIVVPTASPTSLPTDTPQPTSTATIALPGVVATSPTTLGTATATPSPTSSPTTQSRGVTTTPSSTATPSTTATPGTTTPTVSPTSDTGEIAEQIEFDDLLKKTLAAGDINRWSFDGESGDVVYISVSPITNLDISIELLDPNGATLISRNQGASGQVEEINQQSLNTSGEYEILVRSVANSSGDYAIVLQLEDSQPFVSFNGNIDYGESRTNSVPVDVDDMWNFIGTTGDVVTIRVVATGSGDLVLYLNDPDSFEVEFVDDNSTYGPPNDEEIIDQFTLQKSGLFTIGVGESEFKSFGYTLTLERG